MTIRRAITPGHLPDFGQPTAQEAQTEFRRQWPPEIWISGRELKLHDAHCRVMREAHDFQGHVWMARRGPSPCDCSLPERMAYQSLHPGFAAPVEIVQPPDYAAPQHYMVVPSGIHKHPPQQAGANSHEVVVNIAASSNEFVEAAKSAAQSLNSFGGFSMAELSKAFKALKSQTGDKT